MVTPYLKVREEEPPSLLAYENRFSSGSQTPALAHLDGNAHRSFEEGLFWQALANYEKLSADNKVPSQELIASVAHGYTEYKNSAYAPFFLALFFPQMRHHR